MNPLFQNCFGNHFDCNVDGQSAAVPFQIVTSLLGMRPAIHRSELRFNPILPEGQRLTISGLRLGGRLFDIEAQGRAVTVTGDVRGITIVTPAVR